MDRSITLPFPQKIARFIASFPYPFFLIFLVLLTLPIQKRCHRSLRHFSESLTGPFAPLPSYFEKHLAYYLSDVLILLLFLSVLVMRKIPLREIFFKNSSKYLTLFILCSLASLAVSSTAAFSFQYIKLFQFSLSILFFSLLIHTITPSEARRFLIASSFAVLAMAIFESLVGISQYFLQHHLGLKYLGEVALNASFPVSGGSKWLLDGIVSKKSELSFLFRAQGTFPHANILGGFLFFSIFLTYFLIDEAKGRLKNLGLLFALFLQFLALCLTFSRSALIAVGMGTAIWLLFHLFQKKEDKTKIKVLSLTLLLSGGLCVLLFYPQIACRGGILNYNAITQGADSVRMQFMETAVNMLKDHPLLGIGYNNFLLQIKDFAPPELNPTLYYYVHNIYLLIAAEEGLIGLLLFLLFIGSILWNSFKGGMHSTSVIFLSLFLGFLFIGLCDFYPIASSQGRLLFFSSAGFLLLSTKKNYI